MSGVEVLVGLGLLGTELFRYNRENYEFDQGQRFDREELRLKMQVERFALFREDIRDLVELTVGKMDLYHLVGALFLKMGVIYFCLGFFTQPPPPFLLALYYLSNAGSCVYLLLAVWLAMHASISSHSYGTRLLTRFVRLPIPGSKQINTLNARLADFEKQGGRQMFRVPFLNRKANAWLQRSSLDEAQENPGGAATQEQVQGGLGFAPQGGNPATADAAQGAGGNASGDLLASPEFAFGGEHNLAGHEDELLHAVEFRTQRHVQLFRQLQARWQCYDAYARVCMSLGVRQMLQSVSYYLIGVCMVDNIAPMEAYVLTLCFQALAMAISILDIHGLPCYGTLDLSVVGMLPSIVACVSLSFAHRNEDKSLSNTNVYLLSLAAYPLEICWFELLHWVASPTNDDAGLPRHFRAVLFMDVFGPVDDPTEADDSNHTRGLSKQERELIEDRVFSAETAMERIKAAIRRWDAVPDHWMSMGQRRELRKMKLALGTYIQALYDDMENRHLPVPAQEDERKWEDLSQFEREEAPFAQTFLGPFSHTTGAGLDSQYYFDLENNEFLYDRPADRQLLTLEEVSHLMQNFIHHVEVLRSSGGKSTGPIEKRTVEADAERLNSTQDDGEESRSEQQTQSARLRYAAHDGGVIVQPVRLPWQLMSALTRAVQLVWIVVGIFAVLRETRAVVYDFQEVNIAEGRRLQVENGPPWDFEKVPVDWPFSTHFQPEVLHCPWVPSLNASTSLLVGTRFVQYQLALSSVTAASLEEMDPTWMPQNAVTLCGPPELGSAACLISTRTPDGLSFSPYSRGLTAPASLLAFEGPPWRLHTGSIVPCGMQPVKQTANETRRVAERWCLLLAGWASGSELVFTLVDLPAGPGSLPRSGVLRTSLSLPLPLESIAQNGPSSRPVRAVHLSPSQGRLWVITSLRDLLVYDLIAGLSSKPRLLAQWTSAWPHSMAGFLPLAACEGSDGDFWVVGRSSNHTRGEPILLSGRVPSEILSSDC